MNIGDVILYASKWWLVYKTNPALASASIQSIDKEVDVIGFDTPHQVICNPIRQWPYITLPLRKGVIIDISILGESLKRLIDWAKIDDFQVGGSIYLNPLLKLRYKDRLVVTLKKSDGYIETISIDTPRSFKVFGKKKPQTFFDYLTRDDDDL